MMTIINRFFPTESKDFKRPSLERQYTKFYEIAAPMPPDGHLSDQQTNALLGEALTRYIDDFIDAILWPRINTHQKEELRRTFEGFCQASLLLLKKYVPIYPNEIIELWLTELDLELDPSQENFDSKI